MSGPLHISPTADEWERLRLRINAHVGKPVLPVLSSLEVILRLGKAPWFLVGDQRWTITANDELAICKTAHGVSVFRDGREVDDPWLEDV